MKLEKINTSLVTAEFSHPLYADKLDNDRLGWELYTMKLCRDTSSVPRDPLL